MYPCVSFHQPGGRRGISGAHRRASRTTVRARDDTARESAGDACGRCGAVRQWLVWHLPQQNSMAHRNGMPHRSSTARRVVDDKSRAILAVPLPHRTLFGRAEVHAVSTGLVPHEPFSNRTAQHRQSKALPTPASHSSAGHRCSEAATSLRSLRSRRHRSHTPPQPTRSLCSLAPCAFAPVRSLIARQRTKPASCGQPTEGWD